MPKKTSNQTIQKPVFQFPSIFLFSLIAILVVYFVGKTFFLGLAENNLGISSPSIAYRNPFYTGAKSSANPAGNVYQNPFTNGNVKAAYPIRELGNCRDSQECSYYCEVPANAAACAQYAQTHFAKNVLGDTTATPSGSSDGNGRSSGAPGAASPTAAAVNPQFLIDAKAALGCDGYQSCALLCSKTENHQKCEDFAMSESKKNISLQKISPTAGTGTATSLVAICSAFCRTNPKLCQSGSSGSGPTGLGLKVPGASPLPPLPAISPIHTTTQPTAAGSVTGFQTGTTTVPTTAAGQ